MTLRSMRLSSAAKRGTRTRQRRVRKMQGKRGGADAGNKAIVLGVVDRKGIVRTAVISDRKKATIKPIVK